MLASGDVVMRGFQSTPLYEGRHTLSPEQLTMRCFNPRPCTRGDSESIETLVYYALFQSTPLYEGRQNPKQDQEIRKKFQSTPLYEGRPFILTRGLT